LELNDMEEEKEFDRIVATIEEAYKKSIQ